MKVQIREDGHQFSLALPTGLVCSKLVARLANSAGRKYAPDAMENISPEALEVLFAELRRIKKKYGSWLLVEVDSADGEHVSVEL